ncbi:hypothetical protein [Streptomyces sp. G45]|uniref:hypothetical protein n=1 Tax=Streptomyces sp. G45 TaxID=3406627 RepID=UPI003C268A14
MQRRVGQDDGHLLGVGDPEGFEDQPVGGERYGGEGAGRGAVRACRQVLDAAGRAPRRSRKT